MTSTARIVSLTVLTVLIVFLGITFYHVIAPFLLPLFLAGVTAVICQPVFQFFLRRTNNRKRLSAALTTASILAAFLIPLAVGISMALVELVIFTNETSGWDIESLNTWLKENIHPNVSVNPQWLEPDLREIGEKILPALAERSQGIAGAALGVLGSIGSAVVGGMMFVIALYYFFADGPALIAATEGLIPVHVEYQRQLLKQFNKTVRSVVLATFLAAIAQGIATGLLIYIVGSVTDTPLLKHFFIITMISTLASLIPVAGTWLIWGPVAVWLAVNGNWGGTIVVAGLGAGLIGMMDNIIRTYVLQSDIKLHPLLAFISVLGGLQAMGLWGIFIGPIVASCLHALVQIFNTELKELSKSKSSQTAQQNLSPDEEQSEDDPPKDSSQQPAGEKRNDGKNAQAADSSKRKRKSSRKKRTSK
ncbi:MAG: AI-2E family transporter [Planctomycetes bacterium]|nr:AI-2E family transporter [Planctomycetota bacterium]